MKFLKLKQKSKSADDFAAYTEDFNETVVDIMKLGSPEQILQWLFNGKLVEGLNQTQFSDQIRSIYGMQVWPDFKDLLGAEFSVQGY